MSSTKHLPIQPYPTTNGHTVIGHSTAPSTAKKSSGSLTIRTSRHWVLPPRPKPGRKPNHNTHEAKRKSSTPPVKESKKSYAQSPITIKKDIARLPIKNATCLKTESKPICSSTSSSSSSPQQISAPPLTKKQTKTALKKEIQHIKVENSKLKQELGQLVGNLQVLKRKFNSSSQTTTTQEQELHGKKRHYLDDSTLAFLKFEDEDEENLQQQCSKNDPVMLPPLLVSNAAKMNLTSSMSSCKTIPTDDEDILTMSSSTPNSLVSSDLQHSSSLSSASSLNLGGNGHMPQALFSTSVNHSPNSHGKTINNANLKFLDDYEQMEFYDKYMRMDLDLPSQPHIQSQHDDNCLVGLDSIKEEESIFKFNDNDNENDNILQFLNNHDDDNDDNDDANGHRHGRYEKNINDPASSRQCDLFFNVKQENDDLFQSLDPNNIQSTTTTTTITTTTTNSTATNFYMPPSLEELMEEQDGGSKNLSTMTTSLTNNEINDYEDDFDMLKVEVFDMI